MKSLFLVYNTETPQGFRSSESSGHQASSMGFQAQHPTNRFGSKGTPGHTPLSHTPDIPFHNPPNVAGIPNHKLLGWGSFWVCETGCLLESSNRQDEKSPIALWRKATPGRSMPERHRSLQHDGILAPLGCGGGVGEAPCLTRGKTMEVVQEKMYQKSRGLF